MEEITNYVNSKDIAEYLRNLQRLGTGTPGKT